jgi:hypothetical protein
MTRPEFETKMRLTCPRLSELQEVYWTVTDLSAIYTIAPDYWPGWIDLAFLDWVVARRIVTKITLAPGAVLDVARDGKECVLFCRHYLAHYIEVLPQMHKAQDDAGNEEIIIPALAAMWKDAIARNGKEKAIQEMRANFPGMYGVGYKDQLNKSFKIATDGH